MHLVRKRYILSRFVKQNYLGQLLSVRMMLFEVFNIIACYENYMSKLKRQ